MVCHHHLIYCRLYKIAITHRVALGKNVENFNSFKSCELSSAELSEIETPSLVQMSVIKGQNYVKIASNQTMLNPVKDK